jgi:hypothetical protein
LFVIPFCLNTSSADHTGSLNFSRIDAFDLTYPSTVDIYSIFPGKTLYAVKYNILSFKNGQAGLKYI